VKIRWGDGLPVLTSNGWSDAELRKRSREHEGTGEGGDIGDRANPEAQEAAHADYSTHKREKICRIELTNRFEYVQF
jgi:hypothetical protein